MRILAVTAILLGLSAFPVAAQDDGGGFLENLIEDNLSGAGREVTIRGFSGALSSAASLDELTIADDAGVWLTMRDVELDWNRSALLRGRLEVEALTAGEIIVPRLPNSDPEAPTPEAEPFSLPDLPVSVQIDQISAARVELGEALFGAAAVVSLNGSVSLDDGTGAAQIAIERVDGETGALTLDASYDNDSEDLSLTLDLTEAADGIVANLIGLPGRPSLRLVVDGTGPLSDFAARIELDTDGERRLAGTVELTAEGSGDALTRGFTAEIGGDIAPVFAPQYRPFFGPDIRLIASGAARPDGGFALDRLDLTADALKLSGQVSVGADGLPDLIDVTGEIASQGGAPVLLPIGGDDTTVGRVGLQVRFDAAQSEDWTGLITLENLERPEVSIDRVVLDGSGTISDDGAGSKAVTAALDFTASGFSAQDEAVQQALGDAVDGAIELRWSSGAPLYLDLLRLTGQSFALDGSGQVDFGDDGTVATLTAGLEAENLAAFSGLAGRNLGGAASVDMRLVTSPLDGSFDVELDGTARDLSVAQEQADALLQGETVLTLRADRDETGTRLSTLSLSNPAVDLWATGDLSSESSTVNASLRLPDADVLDERLTGPIVVTADAQMLAGTWTYKVDGEGAGAVLQGAGTVTGLDDPSPRIETATTASVADLSRFSGIADRDLGGSIDLSFEGFVLASLELADMSVNAVTSDVTTGESRFDDLLVGRTTLDARVQRDGDLITVQRFDLNGAGTGIAASGSGQLEGLSEPAPLVSGMLDASVNDLSRFAALAGRALSGSVTASVNGSARIDGSEIDAAIDASARSVTTGMPDIDPLLTGPVSIVGQISRNGDNLTVNGLDLQAAAMGLRLTGSGRAEEISGDAPLVVLDATMAAETIAPLSGLAGRPLTGAVDLTVKGQARADLSVLEVTVDGQTRSISIGQENVDRLLRGGTTIVLDADREGEVINLPRLSVENDQITATAKGQYDPGQSVLQAEIAIADLRDLDARMQGRAQVVLSAEETGEVWQVTLDGDAADAVIKASAEVRDALSGNPAVDGQATVTADDLSRFAPLANRPLRGSLSAELSGNARADLSEFDITADVQGRNLATGLAQADSILGASTEVRIVADRDGADMPIEVRTFEIVTPTLTASADGTLLGSDANLSIDARLADIGPFVPGLNGPVAVDGQIRSTGDQLGIDLSATGPGGITLSADGTVAQNFEQADVSLTGRAPLSLVDTFIAPNSVEGTLGFDISVNGPLALSSVQGQLNTQAARFVAPNLNVVLENISLTGDLSGGTIRIDGSAEKQQGGRLTVQGPIALSGGYNAELEINATGLVIEDPRLYRTMANGAVTVTGPLTGGARIAGLLNLIETEVRIPSTGLGATGPIPDGLVHVGEPAAVRATRARAGMIETDTGGGSGGSSRPYPLDLTIEAENRIFIRGRGLDAEMGGSLTLTGTTANIVPSGQFDLVRGRLDLLGKRLTLEEGSVVLQGDFTPYIRFVAQTDTGDVVVLIVVEGPALAPEIDFLSQPELPEEEVLARLLFGKSVTSISPLQAAQLASAVATLAGKGGDGVIANLRKSTGLDDLDITTDDEGNAGLRAGKYLSENLYTDVTVDATGEAEINLNLDVTPSVTLKGGASNSGETSLGVFFERDY